MNHLPNPAIQIRDLHHVATRRARRSGAVCRSDVREDTPLGDGRGESPSALEPWYGSQPIVDHELYLIYAMTSVGNDDPPAAAVDRRHSRFTRQTGRDEVRETDPVEICIEWIVSSHHDYRIGLSCGPRRTSLVLGAVVSYPRVVGGRVAACGDNKEEGRHDRSDPATPPGRHPPIHSYCGQSFSTLEQCTAE